MHGRAPKSPWTIMSRFGARLLGAISSHIHGHTAPASLLGASHASLISTRLISTSKRLLGMDEFFEKGQSLPIYEPGKAPSYGRAWKPDELRIKSFEDLHKLWFTCLKERNLLATQKAEAQRLGQRWFGSSRNHKTLLTMARIKTVLLERQRMHSQAVHLVAVKAGEKPIPTGADVMLDMQKQERLRLVERKRSFRKAKRYRRRQHPLL